MAAPKCLSLQQHINIVSAIQAMAASRQLFKGTDISDWLGTSSANWRRWSRGQRMRRSTAAKLCRIIGISRKSVVSRHLISAPTMVAKSRRSAAASRSRWHLHAAAANTGVALLEWLSRQHIDATMLAGIGTQPVTLSWLSECGESLYYDLIVEPTTDLWTTLSHRLSSTRIPLIEGPLSEELLLAFLRHIRLFNNQFKKSKKA